MVRVFFIASLSFMVGLTAVAQSSIVDKFQLSIDGIDGTEDNKVELGNKITTSEATLVYLNMIDNIQSMVEEKELPVPKRRKINGFLTRHLADVDEDNVASYRQLAGLLSHANQIIFYADDTSRLNQIVLQKPKLSLECIQLIAEYPVAEELLYWGVENEARETFRQSPYVEKQPYATALFEKMAMEHPVMLKSYYQSNYPFPNVLEQSKNDTIQYMIEVIEDYTRDNRLLAMGHFVLNQSLTTEEAYALSRDDLSYFNWLHIASMEESFFASDLVDDDLRFLALKRARLMNELHDEPFSVRFAPVADLSPELIFFTCVYSEEEIFTSTFNGVYDVFMQKLEAIDMTGLDLFHSMNSHRFQTFIKMLANFGKLEDFMAHHREGEQNVLLGEFIEKIEGPRALERAVDVAGALASMENQSFLTVIEYNLKNRYTEAFETEDKEREVLYGILCNLFTDKAIYHQAFFDSIGPNYPTPPIETLPNASLRDVANRNIQVHYFYDDEDGIASFNTFLATFNKPGWSKIDHNTFVELRSNVGEVYILANKWNHEEDGHADMEAFLMRKGWQPNVIVHRGHSYYANLTIDRIPASADLVVIGSCGGYHNLTDVLERSPSAQIISSKQIGTLKINNPLTFRLAEDIRKGNDLQWPSFWNDLDDLFPQGSYAQEKFNDYVPPHKNLGAIFIQAYRNLMGKS